MAPPSLEPVNLPLPSTSPPNPSNASISVRDYIYFLPEPLPSGTPVPYTIGLPDRNPLNYPAQPFEPTSTMVLTSPGRVFVDVRVRKAVGKAEETAGLPNDGGCVEMIEWAFAGVSSAKEVEDEFTPATGGGYPTHNERTWFGPLTHATWTHWLDSKYPIGTPAAQIPVDQGTMYPLSATQTLEHGCATDPKTRLSQRYEELWTDLPIMPTAPSPFKTCVVLTLEDVRGARGVVIRLGSWCQGVIVFGDQTTVERWEFDPKAVKGEGEWVRRARLGDAYLPCSVACREKVPGVGGMVKYCDYEWVVREVVEWKDAEVEKGEGKA